MPEITRSDEHHIAVIGGDLRLIYLAILLSRQGFPVTVYGNHPTLYQLSKEESEYFNQHIKTSESFQATVKNHDVLILPIPLSKDGEHITCHKRYEAIPLSNLLSLLTHKPCVIGGAMKASVTDFLTEHSIPFCDLMEIETVAIGNAIATAEGTILEAIRRSPINLHHSNTLVLGYGRCAKVLAQKLKAMDADVTVAARKMEALSYAEAYGFHTMYLHDALKDLSSYDFIFNTIPMKLLTREVLTTTRQSVSIIDIASAPGGVDFSAAEELGLNVALCLALPGIYAPLSSAKILLTSILDTIQSLEQPSKFK